MLYAPPQDVTSFFGPVLMDDAIDAIPHQYTLTGGLISRSTGHCLRYFVDISVPGIPPNDMNHGCKNRRYSTGTVEVDPYVLFRQPPLDPNPPCSNASPLLADFLRLNSAL